MKYEVAVVRTQDEIRERLASQDISTEERIRTVLSALYYSDTAFCGDMLVHEFSKAAVDDKYFLKNLFETFYGMHRTTYRVEDSLSLLQAYREECPNYSAEILSTIEAVIEYQEIVSEPLV